MYLVKFEGEDDLMAISAASFKVNKLLDYVVFKNDKGEEVALLKMENIRGILKQNSASAVVKF